MSTHFAERAEALRGRLDAPEPTTWRPDDDDSGHPKLLIGELVSVSSGTTVWGTKQIAIVKDAEGALWNVWLLATVLQNEFYEQQPKIGEMLAISYDGVVHRDPKEGKDYAKWRLLIDREGQSVAWNGADGPAAAAEAAHAPQPTEPTPAAASAASSTCDRCGFRDDHHAAGCPNDIPF